MKEKKTEKQQRIDFLFLTSAISYYQLSVALIDIFLASDSLFFSIHLENEIVLVEQHGQHDVHKSVGY